MEQILNTQKNKNYNIGAIDTLNKVNNALSSIETQIIGFMESPSELKHDDFDFTTIIAAQKRIEAIINYLQNGTLSKEISIPLY